MTNETLERIKGRAESVGLTVSEYLDIAEENFWATGPLLTCKECGQRVLIDEEGLSPHHEGETCPKCGVDDEIAYGWETAEPEEK